MSEFRPFIEVPDMSGFEDGQGDRIKFCICCNEKVSICKCMWAAIRSIQENSCSDHSDLQEISIDLHNTKQCMGDLSMKINKIESSLREFEKQRVTPKFEEVRKFEVDHEKRIKDIEYRLEHIIALPGELDIRLEEVERRLDKHTVRKPHVCPVCLGLTLLPVKYIEQATGEKNTLPPLICQACKGNGVVWG